MQTPQRRGVPIPEREAFGQTPATTNWDAIRIFLEVARRGSFRSASDQLGQSINALRRSITELEHQLGITLFTRHVDGVRTTAEGEEILVAARQMEAASFNLIRARDRSVPTLAGEVKLAVTEGLGTFWLAPRLVEFQRAHPKLLVDLTCEMRSADILRLEADASVQLSKPSNPDLKIIKVGRLHTMPFAGQPYIDAYGLPKTREELLRHRIILQVAEHTLAQENYDRLFPGIPQPGFVALRTNTSSTHLWAITKGAGIGMVPTYAHAIGGRMTPVDIGLYVPYDIWLTYHPDSARIPRVRRMIDWLIAAFDPKRFPWFRDEFIHPNDLPKEYKGPSIVNLFEGFFALGQEPAVRAECK
jgi:DNA-binding transcriptional LysR family regulator